MRKKQDRYPEVAGIRLPRGATEAVHREAARRGLTGTELMRLAVLDAIRFEAAPVERETQGSAA
jgi:hypothetical protein